MTQLNRFLFTSTVLLALNAQSGTITKSTVNFCNDNDMEIYDKPKDGWTSWAYCEDDKLHMVLELKVKGRTKYVRKDVPTGNYTRELTGLPCNIAVTNCIVERY